MSPLKSLFAASVVLLSSFSFAQVRGEVVIQSRDGKAVVGRVITETAKGYLLATATGTQVVEFGDIADIRQLAPVASAAPAAAPLVAAPPPVAPAVKPVASSPTEWSEVPPPPPERPADYGVEVAAPAPRPAKRDRTGLHFGLGLNSGLSVASGVYGSLGNGVDVEVQAALDVGFGRPGYRLNVNIGGSIRPYAPVTLAVDNLFTFAVGEVFALGGGLQVGLLFGGLAFFQVSPLLQPAILRLGDRGQHHLALTVSHCILGTVAYDYSGNGRTYAGTSRAMLNYTFLF